MNVEVFKTIELPCGVSVDVRGEFDCSYVDNGFDYEYGSIKATEHDWDWEVGDCESFAPDGKFEDWVNEDLKGQGVLKGMPDYQYKFDLLLQAVKDEFNKLDPESIWTDEEITRNCPDKLE